MASKMYNRARMTVTSTGTGSLSLGVAVAGYQTFSSSGAQNNDVVSYTIEDGVNWEVGTGTFNSVAGTLSRTVTQSYNGTSYGTTAISVTTNAQVYITALAADIVVNGGPLGTPSSGTMTNVTGLPLATGVTGTLPVSNGGTGATTLTGLVKGNGTSAFTAATSGTDYVAPGGALGTPASGTLTNCTGLPAAGVTGLGSLATLSSINNSNWSGTQLSVANGGTGLTSLTAGYIPYGNGTGAFSSSSGLQFSGVNLVQDNTGTARTTHHFGSTGGNLYVGLESSTGGAVFGGSTAYAGILGTDNATPLQFFTNSALRATLDASGRLGVGIPSPSYMLDVYAPNDSTARIRLATTNGYNVFQSSNTGGGTWVGTESSSGGVLMSGTPAYASVITSTVSAPLCFGTNTIERMRIDTSGNLLVGTTNTSESAGAGLKVLNTGGTVASVSGASTSSQSNWEMYSTGASAFRFYVGWNGTVNATTTTISAISDRRLKENIVDLDVGLDAILTLKPRKFDWKSGKGMNIKNARGFIAQEFEQVFPDLIDEWKDTPPEGEEPYKSIRPDLIPVIVKAIQELAAKVSALEAKQ